MITITNPKILKVIAELTEDEKQELISSEVEKRMEHEKKILKPEIKEKIIYIPKNEYIYRKNKINKALIWAIVIFGLALIFFIAKDSFSTLSDTYDRIFNVENFYEADGALLGDSVINPTSMLSRLRDVDVTGATSGQTLTYNGAAIWEASSTAVGLSSALSSGLVFIGNGANVAEASSTSNLVGLPYMSSTGNFLGTWDGFATNTLPYLLKSASTTIPGIPSALQVSKWDQWQQASSSVALQSSLTQYLLKSASTTLPYVLKSASTTLLVLDKGFLVASSTYLFGASSTIPLGYQFYNDTWFSLACYFIGGSSPTGHITCGDGTNKMETLNITGTLASTTMATNNVLQVKDLSQCELESVTNNPDLLSCRFNFRRN